MIWVVFWLTMAWISAFVWLLWRYRHYPERQAMLERAERQHAAVMRGDDRGIYGDYPPAKL